MDGPAVPAAERYARIERLARLKADGTITEEEFAAEKAKLLHSPAEPPIERVVMPATSRAGGTAATNRWLWIVPAGILAAAFIVAVANDMTKLPPPPVRITHHRVQMAEPGSLNTSPASTPADRINAPAPTPSPPPQAEAASQPPPPIPTSTAAVRLTISPIESKPAVTDADWVQMVPATDSTNTDHNCDRPVLLSQVTSLNGGYVYQRVCHWVVSDDIIQVRLADGRRKRVTPGNTLAVIRDGPYRGFLLVAKHKYRPNMGGSYDPTYVVRPDGHEELAVPGTEDGDSEKTVADWLTQHGWHAS